VCISSTLLRGVELVLELTATGSLAAGKGVEYLGEDSGEDERD